MLIGAVFANLGCCGVGVVIRNEEGLIMGAMSKKIPFLVGATEVEAKALEEGIQLAWDLGLRDLDFESNTQVVVGAVAGYDPGLCSIQKVVEGAKEGMKAFRSWSCSYVRRQSNVAAHIMTREAWNVSECVIWVEDTLNVIANQIGLDVIAVDNCPK